LVAKIKNDPPQIISSAEKAMITDMECDVCGKKEPMVKKGKGWSMPKLWRENGNKTICSHKCSVVRIPESYRVPVRPDGCWNCKHQEDSTCASMLGRYCLKNIKESDFNRLPRLSKNELNVDWDGFGTCDEHEKEGE